MYEYNIDSKYASVYAASHSSAWQAVSSKGSAPDISCATQVFNPTGGDVSYERPTAVVRNIEHNKVPLLYNNVV